MLLPNGAFFDWDNYPLGSDVELIFDDDDSPFVVSLDDPDWGLMVDSRGTVQDVVYNRDAAINFSDPREGIIGVFRDEKDRESVNFEYRLQADNFGISLPN